MTVSLFACGKKEEEKQVETPVEQDSITAMQYSDGNVLVRFTRVDGVWKWTDGQDFPLDETFVLETEEAIETLLQAESIGKLEDAALYGFDSAQKYIAVTDPEKTIRLSFGKQSPEGGWYVMRDDQPKEVYLAEDALVQKLSVPLYDMAILPALPVFTQDNLRAVVLDQGEALHLYLAAKDGNWMNGGKMLKDNGLLQELGELSVTKCVDYRPTAGALSLCGFDTPLTVTVNYVNSVESLTTWVMQIAGPSLDGAGYYVTVGEDTTVYEMPKGQLTAILLLAEKNRQEIPTETELPEN